MAVKSFSPLTARADLSESLDGCALLSNRSVCELSLSVNFLPNRGGQFLSEEHASVGVVLPCETGRTC